MNSETQILARPGDERLACPVVAMPGEERPGEEILNERQYCE